MRVRTASPGRGNAHWVSGGPPHTSCALLEWAPPTAKKPQTLGALPASPLPPAFSLQAWVEACAQQEPHKCPSLLCTQAVELPPKVWHPVTLTAAGQKPGLGVLRTGGGPPLPELRRAGLDATAHLRAVEQDGGGRTVLWLLPRFLGGPQRGGMQDLVPTAEGITVLPELCCHCALPPLLLLLQGPPRPPPCWWQWWGSTHVGPSSSAPAPRKRGGLTPTPQSRAGEHPPV